MSRSNPNDNGAKNPAVRWFEWNGEAGTVRYYDKDKKESVEVGSKFRFILLDQLGCVRGWHDASQSAIYSNEIKDHSREPMIVKAFKGGKLAEGIYRDIKDRVNSLGGQYSANCYIAFKHEGVLTLGAIRFKGAALGAWMEFTKANRADLYKKAIDITGYTEGKKGRVIFRVPKLALADLAPESDKLALALDAKLQEFLKGYLARKTRDQVEQVAQHEPEAEDYSDSGDTEPTPELTDDDVPFAWLLPLALPLTGVLAGLLA